MHTPIHPPLSAIESCREENCRPFWLFNGLFLCFSSEKLAYTTLISAVYQTAKLSLFVGTEDLLTSWKVWTHLLDSLNNTIPQQYVPENLEVLEFTTLGERLEFSWKNDKGTCDNDGICKSAAKTIDHYKPELFRNNHLVTGTCLKVIKNLAISITEHALRAVSISGIFQ